MEQLTTDSPDSNFETDRAEAEKKPSPQHQIK